MLINGRVRERFNRLAWKASVAVRRPWVRIPSFPQSEKLRCAFEKIRTDLAQNL